jgi:hypothetical protein
LKFDDNADHTPVVNVDDFGHNAKPMVRIVSMWSAKSAAAFHAAVDCIQDFEEEIATFRFFPERIIRRRMQSRMLDRHAFDKGDQRIFDLLEHARSNILRNLRWAESKYALEMNTGYLQIESRESYFGQAADIAAGIASHLFERTGLMEIVSSFEYVSYNGTRVSLADAAEAQRRNRR